MTDVTETQTASAKPISKRPRKMAREPEVASPVPTEPRANKSDLVIGLLKRAGGATLDEMVGATGWLPHTTRAALTGLKKKGHLVVSEKTENVRRYRILSNNA